MRIRWNICYVRRKVHGSDIRSDGISVDSSACSVDVKISGAWGLILDWDSLVRKSCEYWCGNLNRILRECICNICSSHNYYGGWSRDKCSNITVYSKFRALIMVNVEIREAGNLMPISKQSPLSKRQWIQPRNQNTWPSYSCIVREEYMIIHHPNQTIRILVCIAVPRIN